MPTVPLRQLARCEDAGSDQEHALSAFVHADECSVLRLLFAIQECALLSASSRFAQPGSQIREPPGIETVESDAAL